MNILISHEFSGTVRDAFIASGGDAISCDLLPTESDGPHYHGDVYDILFSRRWDLIVAHPECTKLTVAGNSTYGKGKLRHNERIESVKWTQKFWDDCKSTSERVCFENPVSVLASMSSLPKPYYVHPYWFGHKEQKKTGLYLHNLPPLVKTDDVYEEMMLLPKNVRERLHYLPPSPDRWKIRSKTFPGIAEAMASQWFKGM